MKLLVLLFTAHLLAADDTGFLVWKSPELKGYEQTLHSKLGPDRTANLRLKDINGHPVVVVHREATAPAEFHETYSHLIYVISGESTLVAGGELTGKQTSTPDPIPGTVTLHAESVTGGESREIAAGGHDSDSTQGTTLVKVGRGKQITYLMLILESK